MQINVIKKIIYKNIVLNQCFSTECDIYPKVYQLMECTEVYKKVFKHFL